MTDANDTAAKPDVTLYNSATRRLEVLDPVVPGELRMYVCGPTVYERAHLGNARPAVVFDTLFRLLRHDYGAQSVTYVRNFTDVEDKINARAAETGRAISDITEETIGWYLDDTRALGVMDPTEMPRATAYIAEMVEMIGTLIEKGHAYAAEGHVLFSVRSWSEAYGKLSGKSVDDMIAGARVEVAPYKRDAMDFVLWKPSDADTPGWDSPWGRGRPGWHIECSAMSKALLGPEFDIHGGGSDLMFPHHENEIAQSCCANGTERMARIWLHNEMLQVEGRKMSKSLGNFFTVRDLLDQGVAGEVMRFVMLGTHYRKPMDWTEKKRADAEKVLTKWYRLAGLADAGTPYEPILDALRDDLNTHEALTQIHAVANAGDASALRFGLEILGLWPGQVPDWAQVPGFTDAETGVVFDLLDRRTKARAAKDFAEADRIRDGLAEAGVKVVDTAEGPMPEKLAGFDAGKLEAVRDGA